MGSRRKSEKTGNIAKLVAKDWNELKPEDKEIWKEKAQKDKVRYLQEMANYNSAPAVTDRFSVVVPRRPMSTYLAFSKKRREAMKAIHPEAPFPDAISSMEGSVTSSQETIQ